MIYHDGYHDLNRLPETVRATVEGLRPRRKDFDSIAVTGISGLVVGAPVALRLKKPLVIFRKHGDSHSGSDPVNVKQLGERVLFLDDFISSGETFRRVQRQAETHGGTLIADWSYRDNRWRDRT